MTVSLTPHVAMSKLLMWSISPAIEDEYNCVTDVMPNNPKKLVELLSKIEKLKEEVKSEVSSEDHQKSKGHPDDSSSKAKQALKASRNLKGTIPRKSIPKKV